MSLYHLVISCEHATNLIPASYDYLFKKAAKELQGHKGWDPGALVITRGIADYFGVEYHHFGYSRLLIEVNRSLGHPQLFSVYTEGLPNKVKQYLVTNYYKPYRKQVTKEISQKVRQNYRVIHLSVHTFTPVWEGQERAVGVGLLFDEKRTAEYAFCEKWRDLLVKSDVSDCRYNEPYNGADDGFTTHLRKEFSQDQYLGIELEVSQKYVNSGRDRIVRCLQASLKQTLENEYCRE